jgi:hypothetical protein
MVEGAGTVGAGTVGAGIAGAEVEAEVDGAGTAKQITHVSISTCFGDTAVDFT